MVAKLPPPQKEPVHLVIPFTIHTSICNLFICKFCYFPIWFGGQNFGSDCTSSWSLLIFTFI